MSHRTVTLGIRAMIQILVGTFVLSVMHAAVPNHWLPLVAIGRAEGWSRAETLGMTAVAGAAHTLSTILIGVLVGLLGYTLSAHYELITRVVAPAILVFLGLVYLGLHWRARGHHHHAHLGVPEGDRRRTKGALLMALATAMFFSPCLEIEAYYFTAGALGWSGIAIVSVVYLVVTVAGMMILVEIGRRGAQRFDLHFLEHHERAVTGVVLVILGVVAFLVGI